MHKLSRIVAAAVTFLSLPAGVALAQTTPNTGHGRAAGGSGARRNDNARSNGNNAPCRRDRGAEHHRARAGAEEKESGEDDPAAGDR
jgi:hypothetical protein